MLHIRYKSIQGFKMKTVKIINDNDIHYNCPFSGNVNSCGLRDHPNVNDCPDWDDDNDLITTPIDCPLRVNNSILVKLVR